MLRQDDVMIVAGILTNKMASVNSVRRVTSVKILQVDQACEAFSNTIYLIEYRLAMPQWL